MAEIISIEDRILARNAQNPFSRKSELEYKMPSPIYYAVDFIGAYLDIEEEEYRYIHSIETINDFIKEANYNQSLIHLKKSFKINWTNYLIPNDPIELLNSSVIVEDPEVFNLLLNEFKLPQQEIFNYMYNLYIQLFINHYNDELDKNFRLIFPEKKIARKLAMSRGNSGLIEALNNVKYINGFSSNYIISQIQH